VFLRQGWGVAEKLMIYQVSIEECPLQALLDLKGRADFLQSWPVLAELAFPEQKNTARHGSEMAVYWIGRQHWLIRSSLEHEHRFHSIVQAADPMDAVSATVISDSVSFYRVTGKDADDVLSIASPLDIHARLFPKTGVTYTDVFGIKALLVRCENGYEIGVDRSYFDMIGVYLHKAVSH